MKLQALKIVFWILLAVTILGAPLGFSVSLKYAINLGSSVFALLVIYGYAYKKPFALPVFWQVSFIVNCLIWIRALVTGISKAYALNWGALEIVFFILVSGGLGLIVLVTHFLYAFRSPEIWMPTKIASNSIDLR